MLTLTQCRSLYLGAKVGKEYMESMTISEVSKSFGISTRMLRYYEQAGLIESFRRQEYAYRVYDENAIMKLRHILLLRKLRISVKQIKMILQNPDSVTAIKVFGQNISELNNEILALSEIKNILEHLVRQLQQNSQIQISPLIIQDHTILSYIESLSTEKKNKEEKTMDNLKKVEESLSKLSDVRIIYLPSATVASAHHIGDDPETHANSMIDEFVRNTNLCKVKPDIRHYGFNHPNPVDDTGFHGYEVWVTIPDDMEVPAPLVKKHFEGGLYAAHMISFGNFNEWEWLFGWACKNEKYEFAGDLKDQEHMCGLLDEHLNYINHVYLQNTEPEDFQLDLLMPIKERN